MTDQTEQPLNGQQMAALQKQMADKLAGVMKDIELRKWAVDQACSLEAAALEAETPTRLDPVIVARSIHAFLTEGAAEVKVTISG